MIRSVKIGGRNKGSVSSKIGRVLEGDDGIIYPDKENV